MAEVKRKKKRAKAFVPPKEKPHVSKPVIAGKCYFLYLSEKTDMSRIQIMYSEIRKRNPPS